MSFTGIINVVGGLNELHKENKKLKEKNHKLVKNADDKIAKHQKKVSDLIAKLIGEAFKNQEIYGATDFYKGYHAALGELRAGLLDE